MFWSRLSEYGKKIALIEGEKRISYRELASSVEEFAHKLPDGKRLVALEMQNSFASLIAYLAFLQKRYAIMMLAPNNDAATKTILQNYQPHYHFDGSLHSYAKDPSPIYEELALLLSTSGTTGSKKFVRLSYANIQANTTSILGYLPISSSDVTITTLPLHYSYGLSVLHTHLAKGATVVLTQHSLVSREFWEEFTKYKITNLNGVPYHYELLKRVGFLQKSYSHLRFLTQAGGKLDKESVVQFCSYAKEHGAQFFVMYGQTEATARISYLDPERCLQKPTSIGRAIPQEKIELGEDGELLYRGANVMLGYATQREDLSKGDELGGLLHTGDLATQDSEGDFYIVGRKRRFVKIFGNRVNLDEIESALKTLGHEVVVIGEDDAITLLLKQPSEELKKVVAKQYKLNLRAIQTKVIQEFLYKENGKVDYQSLQRLYGA